jgi:uncharacterized membrane protein YbhN (UPF0104 family)
VKAIPKPTHFALGATLALLVGVSALLVYWAGWRSVVAAAGAIGPLWLAAAILTSLGNYGVRFLRWRLFLLALGHRVAWRRSALIFVGGLALAGTPGKTGELIRSVYLARDGVPYAKSFQLFFWDRFSDLVGVLLLALTTGSLLYKHDTPLTIAIAALVVVLWVLRPGGRPFVAALRGVRHMLPPRTRSLIRPLLTLRHTDARFTAPLIVTGILAGMVAYGLQGLGLYLLATSIGSALGLSASVLVVSVSNLAGAAVFLPAGAGVVEATSVGLMIARGLDRTDAVTLGLAHRLVAFWLATALGASCLAYLTSNQRRG